MRVCNTYANGNVDKCELNSREQRLIVGINGEGIGDRGGNLSSCPQSPKFPQLIHPSERQQQLSMHDR